MSIGTIAVCCIEVCIKGSALDEMPFLWDYGRRPQEGMPGGADEGDTKEMWFYYYVNLILDI